MKSVLSFSLLFFVNQREGEVDLSLYSYPNSASSSPFEGRKQVPKYPRTGYLVYLLWRLHHSRDLTRYSYRELTMSK